LTLVIAHRGASGRYPENTLLAVRKAIEAGADIVEVDVRLSRDGVPVVIHDETLDRTTSGRGRVESYTFEELRAFDAGMGERIPSLEEVLRCVRPSRAVLFIELKVVEAAEPSLSAVKELGMENRVYIISFHPEALERVGSAAPHVRTGLIFAKTGGWMELASELGCRAVLPKYTLTTPGLVEEAHRRGLEVYTWNVDEPREAVRYAAMGVDGIGTNFPDVILRALKDAGFR